MADGLRAASSREGLRRAPGLGARAQRPAAALELEAQRHLGAVDAGVAGLVEQRLGDRAQRQAEAVQPPRFVQQLLADAPADRGADASDRSLRTGRAQDKSYRLRERRTGIARPPGSAAPRLRLRGGTGDRVAPLASRSS